MLKFTFTKPVWIALDRKPVLIRRPIWRRRRIIRF
jgi:hypothetical protein